ncbi:MAG TPA: helix-turn-helix domain-containing protein [Caldimonas sp.]|jgi:cytoskeleton protein RodZ
MSELARSAAAPSAGRLLREARERQGLHIAALAASIKVAPKKLELLEADRFDALPDATFTRALAQTVCRALKIDPAAVLTLLPPPAGQRLEQVGEGLNAPFRERPGVGAQRERTASSLGPLFWVTVLILIAAIGLYFLPAGWLQLVGWRGDAVKPVTAARAESALPAMTPASGSLVTPLVAEPSTLAAPAGSDPIPPGAEPVPRAASPIGAAASS